MKNAFVIKVSRGDERKNDRCTINIVPLWTSVNIYIYMWQCAITNLSDSDGGSLSYSQITELRRKVALSFKLDLGASLLQN